MKVLDKLKNGDYESKIQPMRPGSRPIPVYGCMPTATEVQEFADSLRRYEAKQAEYLKARTTLLDDQSKLSNQFKSDLNEEHGVQLNPKLDELWELVYEYTPNLGSKVDVYNTYVDFVELIK